MRVTRNRFLAVLAVAFMALPAPAFASASYLCHMTGQVSQSPCCLGKRGPVQCVTEIEQQDCCALLTAGAHVRAQATTGGSLHVLPAALLGELPATIVAAGSEGRLRAPATSGAHPPGPARFLAYCAFLI